MAQAEGEGGERRNPAPDPIPVNLTVLFFGSCPRDTGRHKRMGVQRGREEESKEKSVHGGQEAAVDGGAAVHGGACVSRRPQPKEHPNDLQSRPT